jgi:hypothetical protein
MSRTRLAVHIPRLVHAVAVIAVLGPAPDALAQEPPIVGVGVEVNVPALRLLWREDRLPTVTAGVQSRLVTEIGRRWPHWAVSPSGPADTASLVFLVEEVVAPRIDVRLELRRGAQAVMSWPAVWILPGDLSLTGYPTFARAEAALAAAFQDRLLAPQGNDVLERLKRAVPVAQSAQWVGQPAEGRIVIPLAWERYKHLRKSVFRVACEWSDRGDAVLNSRAPGISATFLPPVSSGTASFLGVLLVPREREFLDQRRDVDSVREELDQLRLKAVFLKEYVDPEEWDIAPPASGGNS